MSKHKRFRCFACSGSFSKASIARRGKRPNGTLWYVCRDCRLAFVAGREMDEASRLAAERAA